jgi:TonB-dependent receptor
MRKIWYIVVLSVLPMLSIAEPVKMGTLSVLLFSDGKPLAKNEIRIDGGKSIFSDSDGAVNVSLRTGRHQLEIFGKNNAGKNLGYFKKSILIKSDRNTEVIASLSLKGADSIDIDTPVAIAAVSEKKEEKATGKGTLLGKVLSSEGNTPIAGARVFVRGTDVDVRTDDKGRFSAVVPSGKRLSISVVHSAYSAQTIGGIVVKKDGSMSRTVKLTPASMELEEFVVLAPKVQGSLSEVMHEEKKSSAVTNILGSEEMSKKGDSDAASALKRVTGVTLIGGKSIYVRGLGDRYSNIEMNSLPLPSPDPTKRVVPLDIFPSGVISSMKVQKSGTADVPASFGGGYVDIRTKESSTDDYIKVKVGIKGNSNTGKDVNQYEGSATDWLGFDDGYRDIDQSILDATRVNIGETPTSFTSRYFTDEELSAFVQNYIGDRKYSLYKEALPLGYSASIEGALNYKLNDMHKITVFGNYGYSQEHTYREEEIAKYEYDQVEQKLYDTPSNSGVTERTSSEYAHSGILNIGYSYADVFNLRYTKLYTHNGTKTTKLSVGEFGSNQNEIFLYHDLEWEERTLQADQLNGHMIYELFDLRNDMNFGLEYATATLSQPNNYRYIYVDDDGLDNGADPYLQKTSNQFAKRLSSDDEVIAFYLNNKTEFDLFSDKDYIQIGIASSTKTRESQIDSYGLKISGDETGYTDDIDTIYDLYVRPDIDYDDRLFTLENYTQAKNYFDAEVVENSMFTNIFLVPFDNLEVLAGVRYVYLEQTTTSYYLYSGLTVPPGEIYDPAKDKTYQSYDRTLTIDDLFPSISLKYKFNEQNMLDIAYAQTYIIPDLREASSGIYSHPYEIADIRGNPDLNETMIHSVDVKYSHYFSETENIKVGLFYKYLDQPIEDTQLPSSSLPIYSFQNSKEATMYGFELDGRKGLGFIHSMLADLYISGNFTYNQSEVSLSEEQKEILSTDKRQLQGLSETVVNLAASYETINRSVTLAYNKMGERIRKLGMKDNGGDIVYPDYYENPAAVLDLVWIEKFYKNAEMKIKLGNLLDGETTWYQGDENHVTKKFKKGRSLSISASYKY